MRLKEYLRQNSIKPSWFAERCGMSVSLIHKVLNGGEITMTTAEKIHLASQKNVTYEDLLPWRMKKNEEQDLLQL
jgi:predicted transcriptional regulator